MNSWLGGGADPLVHTLKDIKLGRGHLWVCSGYRIGWLPTN